MALFYGDENFRYRVVKEHRGLGHDVVTAQEAGRASQGIVDRVVLAEALARSRILLTPNRGDFKKLHKKGVFYCHSRTGRLTGSQFPRGTLQQRAGWNATTVASIPSSNAGDDQVMSERSRTVDVPRSLVEGQRLDQPTFYSLYEAMPPGTRAELIGGVVYQRPKGTSQG